MDHGWLSRLAWICAPTGGQQCGSAQGKADDVHNTQRPRRAVLPSSSETSNMLRPTQVPINQQQKVLSVFRVSNLPAPAISALTRLRRSASSPSSLAHSFKARIPFFQLCSSIINPIMSPLSRLIGIALWALNVQAGDEMLIHGWVPEPSGRGTWSILWSCLATIFICTWSALHMGIPKNHGRRHLIFRKVRWMLIAAAGPELILYDAADNYFQARNLLKHLRKHGHRGWTLTHAQFFFAGGFRTRTPQCGESYCSPDQLRTLIENGDVEGPPISDEELKSRGKSDWIIKLVAVLQILWFVVQTLFRAIQHYQTSALEIMTVAFVFCSVFTYGFSFNQPQGIEYPVILDISATALTTDGAASATDITMPATDETKPKQDSDKSIDPEEGAEPDSPIRRVGRVRSGPSSQYVPGRAPETVPVILSGLFACGFGALHCLAWNSPFPTSKERLAWRVCSVTTTALSALMNLLILTLGDESSARKKVWIPLVVFAVAVLCFIGRITITVLAFMTLRALPADAFQTVDWNKYIPHFAA